MANTRPTYRLNRYGQGEQDGESLVFKITPTTNCLERLWLQLTSSDYREGLSEGLSSARFELSKNPHTPRIPVRAYTDAEMPLIKAQFASIDRKWKCLTGFA